MKKDVFFVSIIILMVCSCNIEKLAFQQPQTQNLNISHIQPYMVEGVELSAERPAPHLLSEQEVMIRAAQAMAREGYLDPAHPIYEEVPELATAKKG